ncbi:hypothetical protein MNBD_GAMMA12-790 [hydrothermal vent metagenome]|uniref:Uncharacterized protein n=1 Tax=hydrothermal vent metagenome TaxID=652676 RepID=A0A3B0YNQ1_9ZZZZ
MAFSIKNFSLFIIFVPIAFYTIHSGLTNRSLKGDVLLILFAMILLLIVLRDWFVLPDTILFYTALVLMIIGFGYSLIKILGLRTTESPYVLIIISYGYSFLMDFVGFSNSVVAIFLIISWAVYLVNTKIRKKDK